MRSRAWLFVLFVAVAGPAPRAEAEAPIPQVVEFNRDIRPILADNCFACHGPDKNKRKADLRLDTEEGALAQRDGEPAKRKQHREPAIVPGKPDDSALYWRITTSAASKRMPPTQSGKQLTARQIALLGRWIEQGGKYQKHWSRLVAKRPELPKVADGSRARNAIDRFILARLEQEGLKPAPRPTGAR